MKRFTPRFTLIELLVCISILAIFVAILNGAYQKYQVKTTPFSPGIMETRCEFCKGTGVRQSTNAQGISESVRCPSCNGSGKTR